MIIRNTKENELDTVMSLYDNGREYMRQNGNKNQWIKGFPQRTLIASDIENGNSYVVEDDSGNLVCVFAFIKGPDPTYSGIFDGAWQDDDPYYVIHRIAVASHGKGIAAFVYDWALRQCGSLRIDTHEDNIPMQRSLQKNGFTYCGKIIIEDGTQRIAFQKSTVRKDVK